MSGDVTIGSLRRATYLPGLPNKDGGELIAGQYYYDVYFLGGAAANLTLTDCTINGLLYAPSVRVVTASGSITGLSTDNVVVVNKGTPAATTLNLPASPATNQLFIVKDGAGNANTYNITVQGNGNDIDGGTSYVIGSAYGGVQLIWNGTQWNIIS